MKQNRGFYGVCIGLLLISGVFLFGCNDPRSKSEEDRIKSLREWAEYWLKPSFRVKTEFDLGLARQAFGRNWAFPSEYLDNVKHSLSIERDPNSSERAYRITLKILTTVPPVGRFEDYDWLLFTDTLLDGVEKIYGKRGSKPPEKISAFRVEVYYKYRRQIKPETAYERAVYEDHEELRYAGTFPSTEAEKVTDWNQYIKYCENNRAFIFNVCIDKYAHVKR